MAQNNDREITHVIFYVRQTQPGEFNLIYTQLIKIFNSKSGIGKQKRQILKYLGERLSPLFQACFTPNMCPPHYLTTVSFLHLVIAAGGSQSFQGSCEQCRGLGSECHSFSLLLLPSCTFPVL